MELDQSNGLTEQLIPESTENLQNKTSESGELKLELNADHIDVIRKQYKKVKKYMRSSIYEIRVMDGTERIVNELLDKYYKEEDPGVE
jgi:hypothetical protein